MSEVQLTIDGHGVSQNTQVTIAVPGIQGPVGLGFPSGGTTNQVLFKQSSTNYDAVWGNVTSAMIGDLEITNADVSASAGIAYSKLATLASGNIVLGNASNVATSTAVTGDVTINASGVTAISAGVIVNNDINASAAIDGTKISPNFGSQNVTTTGTSTAASFIPTSSTVPTNGVYLPAANSVALSTNGTGRLFVDSSGRVGVGVALPAQTFQVRSTSGGTTARFENTSSGNFIDFQETTGGTRMGFVGHVNATDMYVHNDKSGQLIFDTNNTERLRITSAGLVGIGTSSPDVGLHYRGDTPKLRIESSNTLEAAGGTEEIGRIEWEGFKAFNFTVAASIRARQDGTWSTTTQWLAPTALEFYTQNSTGVEVTAPRMLIDSSGRVGIGTQSPGGTLDIKAAAATAPLIVQGPSSEFARIDSSGRLLVGTSSVRAVGEGFQSANSSNLIIEQSGSTGLTPITCALNRDDTNGPRIVLGKSRGTTVGSSTIVQNGDALGEIIFAGADGTDLDTQAAKIFAQVDGTPGANDMPGRLVFSTTADGASSSTERMRINNAGTTFIGTTANTHSARLVVGGTIAETVSGTQYPVLSSFDIGTAPDKVPINSYLGRLAFLDEVSRLIPAASAPTNNLDINFEYVSDTSIKIRMKGSDGVVRSTTLTLS